MGALRLVLIFTNTSDTPVRFEIGSERIASSLFAKDVASLDAHRIEAGTDSGITVQADTGETAPRVALLEPGDRFETTLDGLSFSVHRRDQAPRNSIAAGEHVMRLVTSARWSEQGPNGWTAARRTRLDSSTLPITVPEHPVFELCGS